MSCGTGNGHNSVGEAVRDAWRRQGGLAVMHDALLFSGRRVQRGVCQTYDRLVLRRPKKFGRLYRAGEIYNRSRLTPPTYLVNSRYAQRLLEYVKKEQFAAILCTHIFPMETVTHLKRTNELPLPCFGVMTDYASIPFLSKTDVDFYFSSHPDVTAECVDQGMEKDRIFDTGIPISAIFSERLSQEAARKALGIPQDKRMYLVMTGGMGYGDAPEICRLLVQGDPQSITYVLTGKNQLLAEQVRANFGEALPVKPVLFTKEVHNYMAAADLMFSKPGGITSTEACAVGVPLIHTKPIPGIEMLNQELFVRNGLSLADSTPEAAVQRAFELLADPQRKMLMLDKQKAFSHPFAAEEIVSIVKDRLGDEK